MIERHWFQQVRADAIAVLLLVGLWLLFFWRLFTPIAADRVMLVESDFSSQFVTFAAYQYERFAAGEIPLWNPYNNAGLPFIADTQAAVFYPPRLLTIALSSLSGGWSYNALQLEMTVHVLLFTLFTYALVRRLTLDAADRRYSVLGAFVAAIIVGYGGFTSGYPPLQLALLEAAVWLPLTLFGLLEATRNDRLVWSWFALAGLALGLTWLAGHPQTGLYATYFSVAYFAYRTYVQRIRWQFFGLGIIVFGGITFGLVAVQLLPGLEYTAYTMRAGLTFDDKGNGFPVQDVAQLVFPGIVSIWSPLFIGVSGLVLAGIALSVRGRDRLFWGGALAVTLALSLGANGALYHLTYNVLPGMSLFRGQERAAFLVTIVLAVLAGSGMASLAQVIADAGLRRWLRNGVIGLLALCATVTVLIFVLWFGNQDFYFYVIGPVFFSTLIAAVLLFVVVNLIAAPDRPMWALAIAALVVFELFSVNIDNDNYQAYRPGVLDAPPFVAVIQADEDEQPFRVDGELFGLHGNAASLYGVMDVRGISPLFLDGPHAIIQRELPSEVTWELFAVKYVISGAPEIPWEAEVLRTDPHREGTVNLYLLAEPRPYAHLVYTAEVRETDAAARALLADPAFDERRVAILDRPPPITLPETPPDNRRASVISFEPERVMIEVDTPENALLSLAHVGYPGWQYTVDGEPVIPIRAYGSLTAVPLPAGSHTVELVFNPLTYRIGSLLSLVTWGGLAILGGVLLVRLLFANSGKRDASEAD